MYVGDWALVCIYVASRAVLVVKNPPANAGDKIRRTFIPWVGKIPWEGHGNPLQYSA